ncbi:MAG TPA: polysaccharide pyruvyl transferase family protein [Capillibacterium sp.]
MPKVFLFGYYGFGNLGDELMSDYYIKLLRTSFPDVKLMLLANSRRRPAREEKAGYRVVNRWQLWRLGRLITPGDVVVGGGGSLFQDGTSKRSLLYYLTLLELAGRRRAVIFLAGQGIGPLSLWGQKRAAPVLNRAYAIACRDPESSAVLQKMGVTSPLLYTGVDPLWDYPLPTVPAEVFPPAVFSRPVGYILRAERMMEKRPVLTALKRRFGEVRLLTLSPGDEAAAEKMAGEIGLPPPCPVRTLADLAACLPDLGLVLSERLHGLLLAARYGVPGIGLSDDPKLHAFCRQIQWPCWGWAARDLVSQLIPAAEGILAGGDLLRAHVRQKAGEMEQKGEGDRRWLLQQLRTVVAGT